MRSVLALGFALSAVGCNSQEYRTHAFVATTTCGQGPYEVRIAADGTTAEDGVEVIACTPRRLSGFVQLDIDGSFKTSETFGDVADNQRCVGNGTVVATAAPSSATATSTPAGSGAGSAAAAPSLVEQPYSGTESSFDDDVCKPLGLGAQELMGPTVKTHYSNVPDAVKKGTTMHVRIWSDAPNDLSNVIFMVRQVRSSHAPEKYDEKPVDPAEQKRLLAEYVAQENTGAPLHGPPPAPLAEVQPPREVASATWVPGYWTWTGVQWGWIAGFWRDRDVPQPRVEVPGAPPVIGALWIGGAWQRQRGSWIWVGGRWRR